MKIAKPETFSDKEIINIMISLHSDHNVFLQNWGEFIFGKELNLPAELKNRIFCIWLSGVIDLISDKQDQYEVLIQECNKRDLNNCKVLMNDLTILTDAISDSINKISHEEQILLNHHRNCIVHARVYSIHNHKIGFLKYLDFDDKTIKKYNGTKDEFWKLHREIIGGSMDEFMSPLRDKFFCTSSDYYRLLVNITNTPFLKNLTDFAYEDLQK
jgi:hypothetical protein